MKTLVVPLDEDDYRFVLVPGDRQIAWPKLRASIGGGAHGVALTVDAMAVVDALGGSFADVTEDRESPAGSATRTPS